MDGCLTHMYTCHLWGAVCISCCVPVDVRFCSCVLPPFSFASYILLRLKFNFGCLALEELIFVFRWPSWYCAKLNDTGGLKSDFLHWSLFTPCTQFRFNNNVLITFRCDKIKASDCNHFQSCRCLLLLLLLNVTCPWSDCATDIITDFNQFRPWWQQK